MKQVALTAQTMGSLLQHLFFSPFTVYIYQDSKLLGPVSIYSVTCQLLVVLPADFEKFSGRFSKEDNSVWDSRFLKF